MKRGFIDGLIVIGSAIAIATVILAYAKFHEEPQQGQEFGATPALTVPQGGTGWGNIARSTLIYGTGSDLRLATTSTTTLTVSSPLSLSQPVAKVGGSNSVLSLDTSGAWSGTAGSLAADGGNCSAGNFPLGVDTSGAVQTCTDAWTEAENTAAAYLSTVDISANTNLAVTYPIQLSNDTVSFNNANFLGTSSALTQGHVLYSSGGRTVAGTATGTVSAGSGISVTAGQSVIGSGLTITNTIGYPFPSNATGTTIAFGAGLVSNGSTTISGLTSGFVGNNNGLLYGAASSSFFGYTPLNPTRQLTVAGTANQITSSAGAQDLSNDRTWTLSFPNHIIFPGNFQAGNATTTNATTTYLGIGGDSLSELCGTGITCTGNTLAASLGTSITVGELASADFGDWTCNGSTCTLDTAYATFGFPFTPNAASVFFNQVANSTTTQIHFGGYPTSVSASSTFYADQAIFGSTTANNGVSTSSAANFQIRGTASTTALTISNTPSALLLTGTNGMVGAYGGASACSSNNFVTTISAVGGTTCGTSNITINSNAVSLGGSITVFPFTPGTSFGAVANSTSTLLLLTQGLSASSTIRFGAAAVPWQLTFNSTTGHLGLGTSSPFAPLTVEANASSSDPILFSISSSTNAGGVFSTSTLFTVNNLGTTTIGRFGACSSTKALTTDASGNITCGAITGTGDGIGAWFTPNSNFGAVANSTSTPIWFVAGLQASTTSHFISTDFASSSGPSIILSDNGANGTALRSINGNFMIATTSGIHPATTTMSTVFSVSRSGGACIGIGCSATTTPGALNIRDQDGSGPLLEMGGNVGGDTDWILRRYANNDSTNNDRLAFVNAGLALEVLTVNSYGAVGIGTTTSFWPLQIASSTKSQLAISDTNAASPHVLFRNINGNFYLGTSSPTNFSTSTFSSLSISSNGQVSAGELDYHLKTATSTNMVIDWLTTPNQVLVRIGTSATTIGFNNASTTGMTKRIVVCNPGSTASTITWAQTGSRILWPSGTAPTQTTTANKCDIYSFTITQATSTSATDPKILGAATQSF